MAVDDKVSQRFGSALIQACVDSVFVRPGLRPVSEHDVSLQDDECRLSMTVLNILRKWEDFGLKCMLVP